MKKQIAKPSVYPLPAEGGCYTFDGKTLTKDKPKDEARAASVEESSAPAIDPQPFPRAR